MNESHDLLVAWLRDAYAMEKGLIPVLENHAKDARRDTQLRTRIEQHIEETRQQMAQLEQCLARLGEQPSNVKNIMAQVMGAVQGRATGPFQDEMVKNALWDYGSECFEIACYSALSEAARTLGHNEIAATCEQILRQEEAMRDFLDEQLPMIVRDTLVMTAEAR
jgi:ferritin-like metal-binding protein YciE